jgi:hypothetical protein
MLYFIHFRNSTPTMSLTPTANDATDIDDLFFRQTVEAISGMPFSDDGSFNRLMGALGCHSVWGEISKFNPVNKQPPESQEPLVLDRFLCILRDTAADPINKSCMSLIDGLSRNNRWRACVLDNDLAHDLAFVLATATAAMGPLAGFRKNTIYKTVLAPAVCKMLNAWLAPSEAFKEPPTVSVLARAMFGDPWCAINGIDGCDAYEAADIIRASRPRFLVGLVPTQSGEDIAVELPTMEAP